jgi:hypothetical protein
MRGYPLIGKKVGLWSNGLRDHRVEAVIACMATGVIAGLLAAHVKLHLGLSGHKALFWITPVLVARLLGHCRVGTTLGVFCASCTALAFGGHIAGGLMGLPLIGVAGALLDITINLLEKKSIALWISYPVICLAATVANLIAFGKRLLLPPGPNTPVHLPGWLIREMISYALMGMLAGILACVFVWRIQHKRKTH